jgi:acetate kinase
MRRRICVFLSWLGIALDEDRNGAGEGEREISAPETKIRVFVIQTDEEKMIARETWAVLKKR